MNTVLAAQEYSAQAIAKQLQDALRHGWARAQAGATPDASELNKILEAARDAGLDLGALLAAAIHSVAASAPDATKPTRQGTRERILAAALREFSERGYYLATVEHIAERARLGKGTLYHHFQTKESLFEALVTEKWRVLVEETRREFFAHTDLFAGIRAATRAYLTFFERDIHHYRVLLQAPFELQKKMRDQYTEFVLANVPAVRERIAQEAAAGNVRVVDFYTVFYGYMGFLEGVVQQWVYNDCRGSLTGELDAIAEVLFYGITKNSSGSASKP